MRHLERGNGTPEPFPSSRRNFPPRGMGTSQPSAPKERPQSNLQYSSTHPRFALTRPETRHNLVRERLLARSVRGEKIELEQRNRFTIGISLCGIALLTGFVALKMSPQSKIGPYGLIDALSPLYYFAIILLLVSFAWNLRTTRYRSALLGAHLAILVFLIHGAPSIIEAGARFQTAYVHVGFVDYIANFGKTLPGYDARFNWPSFFEGMAMLQKVAGVDNAEIWIRWWPVALNLLYLPLIWSIANHFLRSQLKAWVATAIFPLANWEAQDYFSPQSISYLLYLTFIFILVVPLRAHDQPVWQYLFHRAFKRPGNRPMRGGTTRSDDTEPHSVGFYLGVLVLLATAMATGHQLTPMMAIVSTLILVAAGRTKARGMAVIVPLIVFGWICYGAITFWAGNINLFLGGLGSLGGNVNSGLANRTSGNAAHVLTGQIREFISVLIWGLAVAGAFAWRRDNEDRIIVVLLFFSAFSVIAGGNYGGEGILRIYLFSLPGAVCLIAALISRLPQFWHSQVALSCVLILVIPLFLVARWGNELFEMVRPAELTATDTLYKIAPPGSNLISLNSFITWRYMDITSVNYKSVNLTNLSPQTLTQITAISAENPNRSYVIMTTGQDEYGWLVYGMPQNWGTMVESLLAHSPHYKLRYENADAEIFQYIAHPSVKGRSAAKKK